MVTVAKTTLKENTSTEKSLIHLHKYVPHHLFVIIRLLGTILHCEMSVEMPIIFVAMHS